MKCTKFINLLAVSFFIGSLLVGCHPKPQNTTPLPSVKSGQVGSDDRARPPIEPVQPISVNPNPPRERVTTDTLPPDRAIPVSTVVDGSWPPSADQPFKADTVYFDFDKAVVKASEVSKVERVASAMKSQYSGKAIRIEGHCDERGTEEYNRSLGERRALAVREKLVSLGLNPQMIDTISYGEDRPVDPGHNEAAWSKNRRGEFILLDPPGGPSANK